MDTYKDGGAELECTHAALEGDDTVTEGALGVHDDGGSRARRRMLW